MVDASGAMEFDKIEKGTVMDDDFKLDKDQRRRANACLDQVIDDAEWASYAIIWQRDEIARLRAELAESAKEHQEALDIADRFLRRALKAERDLNGVSAELAEARALVEKREAQIACLVRRPWGSHRHTDIDGVDSWEIHKLGFGDVPTLRVIQYDGTRAGLLAAVDEATKS